MLALAQEQKTTIARERRKITRYPYPNPIYLTPLEDGVAVIDETIVVLGRHLSECGLDFYHNEPVTQKKLIVSLDDSCPDLGKVIMELTWCRFLRHGWYQNGGRFLSIVTAKTNSDSNCDGKLDGCP